PLNSPSVGVRSISAGFLDLSSLYRKVIEDTALALPIRLAYVQETDSSSITRVISSSSPDSLPPQTNFSLTHRPWIPSFSLSPPPLVGRFPASNTPTARATVQRPLMISSCPDYLDHGANGRLAILPYNKYA